MTTLNAELYDALIAIKVPEKKARAAAEAIGSPEHTATKADVAVLNTKINMLMWFQGFCFALTLAMLGYLINIS